MSLLKFLRKKASKPASVAEKPGEEFAAEENSSNSDQTDVGPRPTSEKELGEASTSDKRSVPTCFEDFSTAKRGKHAVFNSKWKRGRPWLKNTPGLGMFCEFCQESDKRPFDREVWNKAPCKRIRLESIQAHEKCVAHIDSVKRKAEARAQPDIAAEIIPAVSFQTMTKVFACLYFLCKQRIAHTTNFEPLLDFIGFLGDKLKEKVFVGRNAHYTSRKSIQEYLKCLSDVLEKDILEELKSSQQFSLMFDETTDCSVREQMVLRARYIHSVNGNIEVRYLKIIDCLADRHTLDAETISSIVVKYIEDHDLSYKHLKGIGTDGAAVMTGRSNGAVKRIRQKQLSAQNDEEFTCEAVGCHCTAHKLNLASQQAGNHISYIKKFKEILRQLYDFFDNSAVRSAGLLAMQKLLGCPERKVLEPSSTRWLSIGNAVLRLKDILPSVVCSLEREAEERGNAVAAGLCRFLSEYEFACTLLLLCDVLPKVNVLSRVFQNSSVDFSTAMQLKQSIVSMLESLKSVEGENLKALDSFILQMENAGITIKYQRGLRQDC
ncbi:hypothetical protein HOLleu_03419 [Holothuria leucospilota]|uniref:Uncharacterized protein n=1 Tax=Holothuria leucospilota TaxID=206669 RepID=A0A9Q1HK86_HOLLE|nr:hypothetical protein HOLleu_03419 [Holothuria leucospilota]